MKPGILKGEGLAVVVVAGGSGTRMGAGIPKQFLVLNGEPVLVRTVRKFVRFLPGAAIVVVIPEAFVKQWKGMCAEFGIEGTHRVCTGGETRFDSVKRALGLTLAEGCEWIAVHDGVRPLFSREMLLRTLSAAAERGCAVPAVEPADSFRIVEGGSSRIVDRTTLRVIQTPQVFRAVELRRAYDTGYDPRFTDDASVAERAGIKIHLCDGERRNIKITSPEDMIAAAAWMDNE